MDEVILSPFVTEMSKEASKLTIESAEEPDSRLTWGLFFMISAALLSVFALLSTSLYFQWSNYNLGISASLKQSTIDHTIVLTYSRAWDFAVSKTSSIFLGFVLIFVGALHILRKSPSAYSLGLEGASVRGSLSANSPGLVIITLGVALVIFALNNKSLVQYAPVTPLNTSASEQVPNPEIIKKPGIVTRATNGAKQTVKE